MSHCKTHQGGLEKEGGVLITFRDIFQPDIEHSIVQGSAHQEFQRQIIDPLAVRKGLLLLRLVPFLDELVSEGQTRRSISGPKHRQHVSEDLYPISQLPARPLSTDRCRLCLHHEPKRSNSRLVAIEHTPRQCGLHMPDGLALEVLLRRPLLRLELLPCRTLRIGDRRLDALDVAGAVAREGALVFRARDAFRPDRTLEGAYGCIGRRTTFTGRRPGRHAEFGPGAAIEALLRSFDGFRSCSSKILRGAM